MKKGLSVLLIAAALFGFYGGATSLNDVLASKDYWEEVGEKSTADMNKLEDGLNQLKDNEKAYLDGQKQLADGEKQLADAEGQLADGEKKLADGRAELAQGYADYAAATGKLADAERQLAAGKAELEDGEEKLNGLSTLISYLNDVERKYAAWKTLYSDAKKDRSSLSKGVAPAKAELDAMADSYMGDQAAAFKGAVGGLVANKTPEKAETTADYVTIMNYAAAANDGITTVQNTVKDALDGATGLKNAANGYVPKITEDGGKTFRGFVKAKSEGLSAMTPYVKKAGGDAKAYADAIDALSGSDTLTPTKVGGYAKDLITGLTYAEGALTVAYNGVTTSTIKSAQAAMKTYTDKYSSGYSKKEGRYTSDIIEGQLAGADGGQGYIATVMQGVASNVLGNKTLKAAVKDNMGSEALTLLNMLASTQTMFPYVAGKYDGGSSFQTFQVMMDSTPGILAKLTAAKNMLAQARLSGLEDYKAGLAKYNAGMNEYNQGLADYKAAPAKLADGEKQLADGEKELADGYKQYEDGKKQLADGKKKLAEYEDGEQQVRDGLATLMATEADPGLESILERRNGDDKFDDANGHLQLDEGLEAVEVGRGYQAESGDLITKEVTNRAVGTAAGLGAAALAVLAAILSFLKKNKGAAVSAVLAAVAGGIGAGVGLSAGEYYSDIAGSTIGNTPFIAAAVLAVVAAVFAIVHFTAKPEAK